MSTMSTEYTSSSDPLTAQLTILYTGRMAARFQCLAGDSLTEAQLLAVSSASKLLGRVGILRYKIHGAKYLSGGITTFGLSVVRNSEEYARIVALFHSDSTVTDIPHILRQENITGICYEDGSFKSKIYCQGFKDFPREKLKLVRKVADTPAAEVTPIPSTSQLAIVQTNPIPQKSSASKADPPPTKRIVKQRRAPASTKSIPPKRSLDNATSLPQPSRTKPTKPRPKKVLEKADKLTSSISLKRKLGSGKREFAPSGKRHKLQDGSSTRDTVLKLVASHTAQVSAVIVQESEGFCSRMVKQETDTTVTAPIIESRKDYSMLFTRLQSLEKEQDNHARTQELLLEYLGDANRLAQEKCYMMDENSSLKGEIHSLRSELASCKEELDRTLTELQIGRHDAETCRSRMAQKLQKLHDRLDPEIRSREYWEQQARQARCNQEKAEEISAKTLEEHTRLVRGLSVLENELQAVRRENARLQQRLSASGTSNADVVEVPAILEAFSQINQLATTTCQIDVKPLLF